MELRQLAERALGIRTPVAAKIVVPLDTATHTPLGLLLRPATFVWLGRRSDASKSADVGHSPSGDRPESVVSSLRQRLRLALAPPIPAPDALTWPTPLFLFQQEGVSALLERESVLLADDMGLGKTVQSIAALRILTAQMESKAALIVVPAGLLPQWRRALRMWAPELRISTVRGGAADRAWQWGVRADVHLVSYETLRSDLTDSAVSPPRRRVWDIVILDEAQKIKNPDSEISRACKRLPRRRAWALTGTPLENKVEDLASLCEFLQPYVDGPIPRLRVGPDLVARHRALQLRRRKADVLDELPPKTVVPVDLELSEAQRRAYDRAEHDGVVQLRALGPEIRVSNVLELIIRLKQLCNVDPATGQSAKLDELEERITAIAEQGDRALVFSQFASNEYGVGLIAKRLAQFNPLSYSGAMTTEERDGIIQRFRQNPEHHVLVLSLRAGGQGLNLQEASYVFHFDRWWNPAVERQAEDRAHRMGQTLPVTVYAYRCLDTIEQRIDIILQSKQELFDVLVDDVSFDIGRALNGKDIYGLFGLESPSSARKDIS